MLCCVIYIDNLQIQYKLDINAAIDNRSNKWYDYYDYVHLEDKIGNLFESVLGIDYGIIISHDIICIHHRKTAPTF